MLIKIRYPDGMVGTVDDSLLTSLISTDQIAAFLRSSGWVVIGRDQVREQTVERRRMGSIINTYV
ncbi:MAG TPA: hypothetical protein VGJ93_04945 [Desulfuromonadaceae bacterium]|jgi:hypothetical protein